MRAIYKFADIYFSNEVLIIFMLTMITCFKFTFAHTHTHMYMCIQIYIHQISLGTADVWLLESSSAKLRSKDDLEGSECSNHY